MGCASAVPAPPPTPTPKKTLKSLVCATVPVPFPVMSNIRGTLERSEYRRIPMQINKDRQWVLCENAQRDQNAPPIWVIADQYASKVASVANAFYQLVETITSNWTAFEDAWDAEIKANAQLDVLALLNIQELFSEMINLKMGMDGHVNEVGRAWNYYGVSQSASASPSTFQQQLDHLDSMEPPVANTLTETMRKATSRVFYGQREFKALNVITGEEVPISAIAV